MRKFAPYLLAALTFSLGLGVGTYYTQRISELAEWQSSIIDSTAGAQAALAALMNIRAGDSDKMVERLEVQLDAALIHMASRYRSRPNGAVFPLEPFVRAKEYRTQFPRITDSPATDEAVARALALAEKQKKQ